MIERRERNPDVTDNSRFLQRLRYLSISENLSRERREGDFKRDRHFFLEYSAGSRSVISCRSRSGIEAKGKGRGNKWSTTNPVSATESPRRNLNASITKFLSRFARRHTHAHTHTRPRERAKARTRVDKRTVSHPPTRRVRPPAPSAARRPSPPFVRASRNNRRTRQSKSAAPPVGGDDTRVHAHTRTAHTRTYTHDRAAARSFVYPSRRSRVNAPRRLRLVGLPRPLALLAGPTFSAYSSSPSTYLWVPPLAPPRVLISYPSRRPPPPLSRGSAIPSLFPPAPFSLKPEPTFPVFVVPRVALPPVLPYLSPRFLFSLPPRRSLRYLHLSRRYPLSPFHPISPSLFSLGSLLSFRAANICRLPRPGGGRAFAGPAALFRTLSSFHVERRRYFSHPPNVASRFRFRFFSAPRSPSR